MDFKITDYKRCKVVKGLGRIDSATAPDIALAMGRMFCVW